MTFFDAKWPAVLLAPLAMLFSIAVRLRNLFYDIGVLKSYAVNCTVISIGNITVGGTGKTPMVQYVVETLTDMGKRVAIISRGYGRAASGGLIVSDGQSILCGVKESGDEPMLLARSCPGAVVAVDKDRVRMARKVIDQFFPDVIVLDDAFQHRRIKRDLDIVMIRVGKAFGNGFILPAGPLREPLSGLRRADVLCIRDKTSATRAIATKTNAQVIEYEYQIDKVCNKQGAINIEELAGRSVIAFCGIANPENFLATLSQLKMNVLHFQSFHDHHRYTAGDINVLRSHVQKFAPQFIITTEKDWVKLPLEDLGDAWIFVRIRIAPRLEKNIVSRFEMLF